MAETALVTGATSGIGASLCLLLASDGYNLVTVARDEDALEQQAKELRVLDIDVTPIPCDLSREGAARKLFEAVRDRNLAIDILVNDAGYSPAGQFSELGISDIRSMLQLCVVNLTELTSVFLHPMLERGRGRILNMSSMMAKVPCPYNALYGAAKTFVLSFTTALASELKHTGVTATAVLPGATLTGFAHNAGIEDAPAWKFFAMDADETAIRAYRALMRGERCAVTGWYNKVGAFSTRFMPLAAQMVAATWLMGSRKHPLDGEDERPGSPDPSQPADDQQEEAKHGHGTHRRHCSHHGHGTHRDAPSDDNPRPHGPACIISWDRW